MKVISIEVADNVSKKQVISALRSKGIYTTGVSKHVHNKTFLYNDQEFSYKRAKWRGHYRVFVYKKGKKGMVTHTKWTRKSSQWKGEAISKIAHKRPKEEKVKSKYWRISKMWTVYGTGKGASTPDPLAQIHIYVVTKNPELYDEAMFDQWLRDVVNIPKRPGTGNTFTYSHTDYSGEGYEDEPITADEAKKESLNKINYYLCFFDSHGHIKPHGEQTGDLGYNKGDSD